MLRLDNVADSDEEFKRLLLHTEGGCQRVTPETILFTVGYSCLSVLN